MSDQTTATPPDDDDDFLDGCDIDFAEFADDEETQQLRALFPDGDPSKEIEWRALFREEDVAELDKRFQTILNTEEVLRTSGRYSGSGRDLGIADRLRAQGLWVIEVDGWQTRGSSTFAPKGSVDHHTAGGLNGDSPSLGICINGRTGLAGPLCNVFISRGNFVYVVAAGRANHAGTGTYRGLSGNSMVYGVEHENTGIGNEPWREDQRVTAAKVHAALLSGIGRDSSWNCQHKEWTSRKIDKWDQSGEDMRSRIAGAMNGVYTPAPPAPAPAPAPAPTGARVLQVTSPLMRGDDVRFWQGLVGIPEAERDGVYGNDTKAKTEEFQRSMGIEVDGKVGPQTREAMSALLAYLAALNVEPRGTEKDRIREIQRLVRTADDGIWGTNTATACSRHMISWKKRGGGITNEPPVVQWIQQQGNRKFNYGMADDGLVGPATNHLIVVGLGQQDEICGPTGFKLCTQ